MLSTLANICTVLGFVLYVALTMIDQWPNIISAGFTLQKLALGALVVAVLGLGVSIYQQWSHKTPESSPPLASDWHAYRKVPVIDKVFRNEKVILDGKSFTGCTFENVTFEINGTAPFDLVGNKITGSSYLLSTNNDPILAMLRFLKEFRYFNEKVQIHNSRRD